MRGLAAIACILLRSSNTPIRTSALSHLRPSSQHTFRPMSSSPSSAFLEAVEARRTIYTIDSETTIPDAKVVEVCSHHNYIAE